jgi:hypothetical protein
MASESKKYAPRVRRLILVAILGLALAAPALAVDPRY